MCLGKKLNQIRALVMMLRCKCSEAAGRRDPPREPSAVAPFTEPGRKEGRRVSPLLKRVQLEPQTKTATCASNHKPKTIRSTPGLPGIPTKKGKTVTAAAPPPPLFSQFTYRTHRNPPGGIALLQAPTRGSTTTMCSVPGPHTAAGTPDGRPTAAPGFPRKKERFSKPP